MIKIEFTEEKWEAIREHLQLVEDVDYSRVPTFTESAEKVEAGEMNPLKALVDIRLAQDELDQAESRIKSMAVDEAYRHPEKIFKAYGAVIEKRNGPATWDYSGVAAHQACKEKLKWIEKMAQAGGAADMENGEVIDKAVRIEGKVTIAIKF